MIASVPASDSAPLAEILTANLAALWAVDPRLAIQVDAIPDSETLVLEPTRSGAMTLALTPAEGQLIYLHSKYDPVDEAARQVSRLANDKLEIFLLGLGLGYHPLAVTKQCPEATIWAFEPDVRIIRAALQANDLSDLLLDKKLRIVREPDKSQLFTEWLPHLGSMSVGQDRVDHAPSLQLHPQFFADAKALVEEFLAFGKTTLNTLLINGRRTCENLAQNVAWYVASPGLGRLKNAMRGKPAVIVSAGPSLRKNKHLLPSVVGRACVIAVQTTFQQLIDIGVEPDFVTSLDYHDICTQFFQKIPRHVRTELVAEAKATPKVFALNPGPLSLLGNDFVERLLREMRLDRPKLPAGATVAHLAFYLAQHMG